MLFDTDVVIWALRGRPNAAEAIEGDSARAISVVSYMELIRGARDKREVRMIKSLLVQAAFRSLPLSENIGHRASIYMEEFGLKCGMDMADALLAATAVENDLPLCTGNARHYRPVSDLVLRAFLP